MFRFDDSSNREIGEADRQEILLEGDIKSEEPRGRTGTTESSHTSSHTSLRFMPTRHEVGLRRNPSTVSNCVQKKPPNQREMERRSKAVTYRFLGVFEYECVAAEDGGHEDLELHVREILAHTRPIIHAGHEVSFTASGTNVLLLSLTLGRTRTD